MTRHPLLPIKGHFVAAGICLALGVAQAVTLPFTSTYADARYQGDDGGSTSNTLNFPVANPPGSINSHVLVPVGGFTGYGYAGRDVAFDDAEGFARSTMPGTTGAYARAGGYSPGHGAGTTGVVAHARTSQYLNWHATGAGSTAVVDLLMFLDGFLYVSTNSGTSSQLNATVKLSVDLDTAANGLQQLLYLEGDLNHVGGLSTGFSSVGSFSATNWNSSWSDTTSNLTSGNGHDRMFDVNYSEVFTDMVTIPLNETFGTLFTLEVIAENNEGPFEIFATSDFNNTGQLNMRSNNPNVDLQMVNLAVPEPGSVIAIGLGLAVLAMRRRR